MVSSLNTALLLKVNTLPRDSILLSKAEVEVIRDSSRSMEDRRRLVAISIRP